MAVSRPFFKQGMRRCLLGFVLLACASGLVAPVLAIDSLAIRYAAEMTRLPAGSDITAMGETGVVLPRHATGALWNPSAAAFLDKYEFSAEFADLYMGMSQQGCVSMMIPMPEKLGASVMYMPFLSGSISLNDTLTGTFDDRTKNKFIQADGSSRGSFTNNQHLILVSLGKRFSFSMPRSSDASFPLPLEFGLGCSFKSFWQTMKPDSLLRMGMGINLDAGGMLRMGLDYNLKRKEVSRFLFAGVTARDFVPNPVVWVNSRDEYNPKKEYREEITPSYLAGIGYVDKSGNFGGTWTFSAAIEQLYRLTYHFGIEAEFADCIAFRAGLSDRVPSVGAGIRYKKYFLDYAFRFDELAYSVARVALGVQY